MPSPRDGAPGPAVAGTGPVGPTPALAPGPAGRPVDRLSAARPGGAASGAATPTPVRLVATDLDGTLLDPAGRLSRRAVDAVAAVRAAGIHVVPVTGRPPQSLWALAAEAPLGPLGVCSNGAVIVDPGRAEILEVEVLAGRIAEALVDAVRAAVPGIRLACDDAELFAYEHDFFDAGVDWEENLKAVPDVRPMVAGGCLKLLARLPGASAAELLTVLEGAVGAEGHVTSSGVDWVDIGAPQVSKAYALERVCTRLGIGVDEVVAVGDNYNDLPVLAWAGRALAPANAIPEVLAMVERVLPANGEDGVAAFLEELVGGSG